jgi:hypothetical protein
MSSFTAEQLTCQTCTRPFYACDCEQGNAFLARAARLVYPMWDETPNQHNLLMGGRAWGKAFAAASAPQGAAPQPAPSMYVPFNQDEKRSSPAPEPTDTTDTAMLDWLESHYNVARTESDYLYWGQEPIRKVVRAAMRNTKP